MDNNVEWQTPKPKTNWQEHVTWEEAKTGVFLMIEGFLRSYGLEETTQELRDEIKTRLSGMLRPLQEFGILDDYKVDVVDMTPMYDFVVHFKYRTFDMPSGEYQGKRMLVHNKNKEFD